MVNKKYNEKRKVLNLSIAKLDKKYLNLMYSFIERKYDNSKSNTISIPISPILKKNN